MVIINFLKEIFSKSQSYQSVWTYILSCIELDKDVSISIFEISAKSKVQKKTLYPILNYGFIWFLKSDFEFVFYLHQNKIIISRRENVKISDLKQFQEKKKKVPLLNRKKVIKATLIPKIEIQDVKYKTEITAIIDYLNFKTNKEFDSTKTETISIITNRLTEGFTMDQFLYVIDIKTHQWLKTNNNKYLRPSTLFSNENMENYINENYIIEKLQSQTKQTHDIAEKAKRELADRYNKK